MPLVGGCGRGDTSSEEPRGETAAHGGTVIASYRGRTLTSDDVSREFERLPAPSRTYLSAPERKRQFVENLVMNDLLYEEGQKAGYDKDPEIDHQVADLRKRLVVQRVMRQYQTPPTVSDEQVRAYYDKNLAIYSTTQIHASHILVKDENTARQILAEVKAHPDQFADIAREKSTDTISARKGGDLGTFGAGRMVPEFERVAFSLKPGEISDVVKTQYGYHIIMVTERKEGEPLRNRALQDQVQGHFDQLKKDAHLEINEEALARLNPPPPAPGQPLPPVAAGH
jgi:peptidyl-prolyl cis-trans isomerase C